MNYFYTVYIQGCWVKGIRTHSYRRFLNSLGTINWQIDQIKVRIITSYGTLGCEGIKTPFSNEGTYASKKDLFNAIVAFREVDE